MDLSIFADLISPIIVIACLIIGYIVKNIISENKINRFIPLIVCGFGIFFNVWALHNFDFNTVIMGAASGLASTGAYEAFKNIIEKNQYKD